MRGDFSRLTWHPGNGYRRVMLQQGRVLLDADFNAQGDLSAHALRVLTRDLLGPHAGPAADLGFAIAAGQDGFTIARGRYYVDGWLAANEGAPLGSTDPLPYESQEGFSFPGSIETFESNRPYFFYLDVWERAVSWLEDETIREVALGGPDTALRRELVWQVRAIRRPTRRADVDDSEKAGKWLSENVKRHPVASTQKGPRLPQMKAFVDPKDDSDDTPCVADPVGGYTGIENQLYRVEIHAAPEPGQTGPLTFKWSRDNGSVVAAWIGHVQNDLEVGAVRDTRHGFSPGQWVELTDKYGELRGVPGVMVQLKKAEGELLTYDPASASGTIPALDDLRHPIVRRWDHRYRDGQDLEGGAVVLEEDEDYALERGVKIRFPKQDAAAMNERRYRSGDYWTIPARTATADIEWPFVLEAVAGQADMRKAYQAREPDGVEHVFAPLAVTTGAAGAIKSLQRTISPLWTAV